MAKKQTIPPSTPGIIQLVSLQQEALNLIQILILNNKYVTPIKIEDALSISLENAKIDEPNNCLVEYMIRPTIQQITAKFQQLPTREFYAPIIKNKGRPGLILEEQLGIPHSSEALDCIDGELKCFPLKKTRSALAAKESVAVTMVDKDSLLNNTFQESKVYKKLANTLFIPYSRKEDMILFNEPILFTAAHPLFKQLEADYEEIREQWSNNSVSGRYGKYLQTRTKGAGHGSTSRAFYLRPSFLNLLFIRETQSTLHLPENQAPSHSQNDDKKPSPLQNSSLQENDS